jgi:hypothetical protein
MGIAMTQILSLTARGYVLQASDRLVSMRRSPHVLEAHDPLFNKHILYVAKDAVVSIGFTGLAYISGIPTDQWIASVLTGEPPWAPQGGDGRGTRHTWLPRPYPSGWLDIGQATNRLRDACAMASSRMSRRERQAGLTIVIAGLQGKWKWESSLRKGTWHHVRPITNRLIYGHDPIPGVERERLPRYWFLERGMFVQPSPQLPLAIRAKLEAELEQLSPLTNTALEGLLIRTIRAVSMDPLRGVGGDCLSVSIAVNRDPIVRIHYDPASPASGITDLYTGWIIGPTLVQPPQLITMRPGMSMGVQAGWVSVKIDGPPGQLTTAMPSSPQQSRVLLSSRQQPRMPPPR